ncbi:HlyD family secretion protein [Bradyrhizobium liaoningense]|uniref:HlyD family secretion protein n=1 Tax=Bradyrhizobium liaoningense TaxID=43992 RepID=UPI001BAAF2E7|nr:HlyD family efflux transporter periplasmic adaptor subunit [Bradyrhizobium liaoningense]MBR0707714.1 HlyD family efflux transporter periplasmic adaptor subunit [Bradyrhizobium liaoningense]
MNVAINRLDPNVPDPVESRRSAAGRLVRLTYATAVFGVLAFLVVYFGAPLVYLSGPGTVSSPPHVVSLPYLVQVAEVMVTPGTTVKAGDRIAQIRSPERDNIVATYMRALADIASRRSELRIRARVAQETLEAAKAYRTLTEDAVDQIEASSAASLAFRLELLRERGLARKSVISQEAEIAESISQLADLDDFGQQLRDHLDDVERNFAGGQVLAPVAGIVSTNLANVGQSLVAGTAIAEILDPTDIFVDWYIPNARLVEPRVGNQVLVVFGNRRIAGTIAEILPVSVVYAAGRQPLTRERTAAQIARIRFVADAAPPPLNSTVSVHMYYTNLASRFAAALVRLLGLQ